MSTVKEEAKYEIHVDGCKSSITERRDYKLDTIYKIIYWLLFT